MALRWRTRAAENALQTQSNHDKKEEIIKVLKYKNVLCKLTWWSDIFLTALIWLKAAQGIIFGGSKFIRRCISVQLSYCCMSKWACSSNSSYILLLNIVNMTGSLNGFKNKRWQTKPCITFHEEALHVKCRPCSGDRNVASTVHVGTETAHAVHPAQSGTAFSGTHPWTPLKTAHKIAQKSDWLSADYRSRSRWKR